MRSFAIAKKDDNETSVRSLDAPDFCQLQGVFVKGHTLFQIQYIDIIVGESKFHIVVSSIMNCAVISTKRLRHNAKRLLVVEAI